MTITHLPVANILLPLAAFAVAFVSALWLHPKVVRVAKLKNITDNPDKRKLQREPVPVLGGTVAFFGIVLGMGVLSPCYEMPGLMLMFTLMLLMLYTGTLDDIFGLTPGIRFVIEILAALAVIYIGGYSIDNFHGLWGIGSISPWISVPLTVVTVVGIINAINLIDGVNGLSSGYCIMSCAIFGVFFYLTDDMMMTILSAACIGALIPFFVHNVFGNRLRMFIGDGGTLMMGMVLSLFVLRVWDLDYETAMEIVSKGRGFGLIPFTLAVLSIPVFDTLRVMTHRMMHGTSPFSPDKTHLHHAFIGMGFSHLATTLSILGLNLVIVAGWYALYVSGFMIDVQFHFVLFTAILFDVGVYFVANRIMHHKP
ncbi:MAG: undecaprenyl/decaprenyl-phosphate alpha-N-acetylglucosaminyl 1-phosphate transferase [Muribaculaceae bacterium]|nr:undecaprenyl/decaprenyl-phosphate alpha-N-acetylglucosaminyl 1-phosphate transferase [Muribaculaceae bacterium]